VRRLVHGERCADETPQPGKMPALLMASAYFVAGEEIGTALVCFFTLNIARGFRFMNDHKCIGISWMRMLKVFTEVVVELAPVGIFFPTQ